MDSINDCVKKYLSDLGGGDVGDLGWTIMGAGDSAVTVVAGRGIVATRDYSVGEVIFVDGPLIVSPRVIAPGRTTAVPGPICPVCYASAVVAQSIRVCPGGCGLPVCGPRCADSSEHEAECRYVRQLRPGTAGTWSVGVYNAVAPIRGRLVLKNGPYQRFRDVLQKKSGNEPVFEVSCGKIDDLRNTWSGSQKKFHGIYQKNSLTFVFSNKKPIYVIKGNAVKKCYI